MDNQDFFVPVAIIVKKETEKAVHVEAMREVRQRKFVEGTNGTGTQFASSSDRPPTVIPDKRTNKNAYSETSEESKPKLPP